MSAKHIETGKLGEQFACRYLEQQGYKIVCKNWRKAKAEIDIIGMDGEILVFVEVKTRKNNRFGYPEQSITAKKESLMSWAAGEYMYEYNFEGEIRFDVMAITLEPIFEIEHFKDVFFPGL